MDNETKQALLSSIEKWTSIVAGPGEDEGPINCALCKKFFFQTQSCKGCPVMKRTKLRGCEGTPYTDWWDFMFESLKAEVLSPDAIPLQHRDRAIELAQAELEFLQSLLEQEELKA